MVMASERSSVAANGRIAAGSMPDRLASSGRCGPMVNHTTDDTIVSLISERTKPATPSMLNSRLKPWIGFSLEKSGFSLSGENMNPCWSTLPTTPETIAAASTMDSTGAHAPTARRSTSTAPPSSSEKASGASRNGTSRPARSRQAQPP